MIRTAGAQMAAVRQAVAERGRRTIRLPEDRDWLTDAVLSKLERPPGPSWDLAQLLKSMTRNSHLYRVRRGRYVLAADGTFAPQQVASAALLADLILSDQGDYYLSHLSALIAHRLTDMHSSDVFATIRTSSHFRDSRVKLPGGELRVVRLSDDQWPEDDSIERIRALDGSREFVKRASIELTLVDSIARPDLCSGFETVVGAWARALPRDVDWPAVAAIADKRSDRIARRIAFLLKLVGKEGVVASAFPDMQGRGYNVPLDSSKSLEGATGLTRDPQTGVVINVPRSLLDSWVKPTVG
jgi:predicted transcriptional regulator of viral defense system